MYGIKATSLNCFEKWFQKYIKTDKDDITLFLLVKCSEPQSSIAGPLLFPIHSKP